MRKHLVENAAFEVATQVRAVEESIDAALAEIADLQSKMMKANAVAPTGFATVHPALEKVSVALAALVNTRGAMVECHAALAEAKTKVPGLRTVMIGDGDECPPTTGRGELRIVA